MKRVLLSLNHLLQLLHQEVIPAIGCTEPICVALCVARAKERLGVEPDSIHVQLSKNIYKNAMAVGIPNTNMTGLPIAIALGATIGRSELGLEVLHDTTPEAVDYAKTYMSRVPIQIDILDNAPDILYVHVEVACQQKTAEATIMKEHTHFVEQTDETSQCENKLTIEPNLATPELTLQQVYDFAMQVNLSDVEFLKQGAEMNIEAAQYSFTHDCGHRLGQIIHNHHSQDTLNNILSYTAGACDARMSGAMVPVMSNSGSGNQGISCSVPVYIYAQEHHCSEEQTLRALTLSNLTVIYIKQSLGRLSALCGCVVAATGSAAGLTLLMGGGYQEVTYAIKNMIANLSGMICDGAKPGCALKVTSGVTTAVLSATMAMEHSYAEASEGIVEEDIDRTIHNLTRIGHDGMLQTDDLIIDIMTHKPFAKKN